MAVRLVLVCGLCGLVIGAALALNESFARQAASNRVPEAEPVVQLRGVDRHCQKPEGVPSDAARLRLLIGTHGLPTPTIRLAARTRDGRLVATGRLSGGREQGHVLIPVRQVAEADADRVCLSITSANESVLYGAGGRVRLEWLRASEESWWGRLPTVAQSFAYAKVNPLGVALLPAVVLLSLVLMALAGRLALRELRR